MFCVSCGKEIEDNSQFCGFCGARQPETPLTDEGKTPAAPPAATAAGQTAFAPSRPAAPPAAQRKPMPGGVKALLIAVVALAALFFGAREVLGRVYSPEKTIDRFIEAVRRSDGESLRSVAVVRAGETALDDAVLAPFFTACSRNEEALARMRSTLTADAQKLKGGNPVDGDGFLRLKGEEHFFLFSTYAVEVTPLSVRVQSEFDNTAVTLGAEELSVGTRATEVSLMPGRYAGEAVCTAPGTGVRLVSAYDVTLCPAGYEGFFADSRGQSLNVTFDYTDAYLEGNGELRLESIVIDGNSCDLSLLGNDLYRGITLAPLLGDSVIEVTASAGGETYTETFRRSESGYFYMDYAPADTAPSTPATEDSPAYLWNDAAASVASAIVLGSSLREAAESGWAAEWITLYYYNASDPDPAYVTARTHDIPLDTWLERYVTYSGASAAGWGDIWLSLVVDETPNAQASSVEERFLEFVQNCDSRYFTRADLEGFDADMAILARNAPYAHAGRKFANQVISAFFQQFSWYYPLIEPDAFRETMLNSYETANKDLVVEYEHAMGYK